MSIESSIIKVNGQSESVHVEKDNLFINVALSERERGDFKFKIAKHKEEYYDFLIRKLGIMPSESWE